MYKETFIPAILPVAFTISTILDLILARRMLSQGLPVYPLSISRRGFPALVLYRFTVISIVLVLFLAVLISPFHSTTTVFVYFSALNTAALLCLALDTALSLSLVHLPPS